MDRSESLLAAAPSAEAAEALAGRLRGAGRTVVGTTACCNLVREAVRLAPQGVVVEATEVDAELLATLAPLQAARPLPVLVFAPAAPDLAAAACDAGVWHWGEAPCEPAALALTLPLVLHWFHRQQALQHELTAAQARLDERKWVDRAKGVLMSAQQLSEPDAFALLRTASMQTNLRVGEVSRAVIEAAEAADAVNRAGQLRMLSQRIVKALALTQLGIERASAEALQQDSLARAQASIDHLSTLALPEDVQPLRAAALASWQDLQRAAAQVAADLGSVDAFAQRLLDDAQGLTDALEQLSGRRSLHVINLSGRQRMLSQRIAKQALLAGCLPEAAAQAAAAAALASATEFDAALQQLERSPLAGEEIRATLAIARGQWQRLLEGMRGAGAGAGRPARDGRLALARESEALLQSFERLTSLYEHSMQVLLG
ncbi:type IV pili methyl-accepting chemotaxis transducer N-terminal domain-containing protein [Aquincola sp. S2]|uniref:Type IV pili methyl-accepting chemotaxis transducer N-terminal domain-containing protein n=1 Tax=Pseudaquabacterium terrae TaxID=2732868 RepID=A0ABX2EP37_9BURK|nr:type IV pili methyl-accepting chemotaxis transducer N-terminal domain-containing protein [Aquabacterium terrae]